MKNNKKIIDDSIQMKECIKCLKMKNANKEYYMSYSEIHSDGRVSVCKTCLSEMFDENDMEGSLKELLRQIDKPYVYYLLDTSIIESPNNIFGKYMKNVGMRQFKGFTWKDSIFKVEENENREDVDLVSASFNPSNFKPTDPIINKWGFGYEPEEYFYFEKKYSSMKNNYLQKTAMHTEALLNYIRYQVKAELATAKGDAKGAKDWGGLAKDAATAAKINPSQLSKSDLSDGLDTFSQLVRTVEQAVDVIAILPKFREKPQDSVDFTIWCYINYIRDLKGLPLVEYKEIYKFYDERKKEYDKKLAEDDEDGKL